MSYLQTADSYAEWYQAGMPQPGTWTPPPDPYSFLAGLVRDWEKLKLEAELAKKRAEAAAASGDPVEAARAAAEAEAAIARAKAAEEELRRRKPGNTLFLAAVVLGGLYLLTR